MSPLPRQPHQPQLRMPTHVNEDEEADEVAEEDKEGVGPVAEKAEELKAGRQANQFSKAVPQT